jgi:hypothetical protein
MATLPEHEGCLAEPALPGVEANVLQEELLKNAFLFDSPGL